MTVLVALAVWVLLVTWVVRGVLVLGRAKLRQINDDIAFMQSIPAGMEGEPKR